MQFRLPARALRPPVPVPHPSLTQSFPLVVAFNLYAQIAQLFQSRLTHVVRIRPDIPREHGNALQREVLGVSRDERGSGGG